MSLMTPHARRRLFSRRLPARDLFCGGRCSGAPVAIINRNAPAFYCVPADLYGQMLDALEDAELNALADAREGRPFVSVDLSEL